MPVTAKLSKHFYDVLGEDVANELVDWFNAVDLTYRTELRELNELNYARFDAKLEQRLAELRAELRQEMAALRSELRQEMAALKSEMRQEMAALKSEMRQHIAALKNELGQDLAALKDELGQDMASLSQGVHSQTSALREADAGIRGDLRAEIHAMRASLLRWMFGFWVTSTLTLGGLIAALLARAP